MQIFFLFLPFLNELEQMDRFHFLEIEMGEVRVKKRDREEGRVKKNGSGSERESERER